LGRPTWTGRDTLAFAREGFGRNAIAYRCVRLIAEAAASTRMAVTPVEHPLATLLAAPNPEQTAAEFLETFFGHLQVSGNAFMEAVALGDDPPRELHVLRPDRMAVIPGARGWPIGWEHRAGAQVTRYERDPVTERSPILHLNLFSPADDWYGQSPMEAAASAIDSPVASHSAAEQTADFGSLPSSFVVRLAQISSTYGPGGRGESTIWL
jgi:HK97 family phage portal protein